MVASAHERGSQVCDRQNLLEIGGSLAESAGGQDRDHVAEAALGRRKRRLELTHAAVSGEQIDRGHADTATLVQALIRDNHPVKNERQRARPHANVLADPPRPLLSLSV